MRKLREPVELEFQSALARFSKLSNNELENLIRKTCTATHYYYDYDSSKKRNLTLLPTPGCSWWHNSGCSMCNYMTDYTQGEALMQTLKQRNPKRYAELIRESFFRARENNPLPGGTELISGYNCFCPREFPIEVFQEIFGNPFFSEEPRDLILEVRAPQVTEKYLQVLKKLNSRISLEIGVETSDEWLRNHWINKNVSNKSLIDAKHLIESFGMIFSPNLIAGIPGFTEEQFQRYLIESMQWLYELNPGPVTILPLNRKKFTLHGFLYEHLSRHDELTNLGLVSGEHTGIPWLYTIAESLEKILKIYPQFSWAIQISQLYPYTNSIENTVPYNSTPDCKCNEILRQGISTTKDGLNVRLLSKSLEEAKKCCCYDSYQAFLEKQKSQSSPQQTMRTLASQISRIMWPDNYASYLTEFERELSA